MIEQIFVELPFSAWSSVAFYAALVLLLIPAIRLRVVPLFVSPTPSTNIHLAPLDVLRGLFALWVAAFHYQMFARGRLDAMCDVFPGILLGNLGVPCFTVLSGMLIYMSVKKMRSLEDVRKYIKRRFLRIYPLYIVTSFISLFLCVKNVNLHWITSEILMLYTFGYPKYANAPAWSLYVEIAYYMVIPFLVIVFPKSMRSVSIVLILALMTIEGIGNTAPGGPAIGLWRFFFVGILCAEFLDKWRSFPNRYGVLALAIGLFLISLSVYSNLHPSYLGNREKNIALVLGIPLLVLGSCSAYSLFSNIVFRIFGFLGTISYSIYMTHCLLIRMDFPFVFAGIQTGAGSEFLPISHTSYPAWVFFFMIVPAIIIWSSFSYALIERPFLKLRPPTEAQ